MKILGICAAQGALIYRSKKYLVANVEPRSVFHTKNNEQWKLNFGDIPFVKTFDEIPDFKNINMIIGSPSCGHSSRFSYSRKKSLGKPKEDPTITMFTEAIIKYKPQIFIMENLPKLIDLIPISEWEATLEDYEIVAHCHPVSVFGNSQIHRKRLILIGINKNASRDFINYFKGITPKLNKKLYKVAQINPREHLNFKEDDNKKLSMYHYADKARKSLTVAQVRNLWQNEFKDWYRWPMIGHKMKTLPGVYRNKPNDYPLTLRPSNRQFGPNGDIMGLDEYRIIMGFPKRFKIYFEDSNKTYWLNKGRNALAKGSVYEIGLWIYRIIREYKKVYEVNSPYARTRINSPK